MFARSLFYTLFIYIVISTPDLIEQLRNPKTRRRAFESVVSQYSEAMYWKIRHIVTVHEDADDVLQNAFVKAWLSLDKFRGESSVSTWLYRICVNESLDHLRRKRLQVSAADMAEIADTLVADRYFEGDEVQRLLQKAIDTLPEAQRAAFTLRYFDEMPYKDMSEIMGTTESGLKTNYHLAVKKIIEFFNRQD